MQFFKNPLFVTNFVFASWHKNKIWRQFNHSFNEVAENSIDSWLSNVKKPLLQVWKVLIREFFNKLKLFIQARDRLIGRPYPTRCIEFLIRSQM